MISFRQWKTQIASMKIWLIIIFLIKYDCLLRIQLIIQMMRAASGDFRKMKKTWMHTFGCGLFEMKTLWPEWKAIENRSSFLIGISSIGLSSQRYLYYFSAQILPSHRNASAWKTERMCIIKDSVVGTYQHPRLVGLCQPVQIYLDPI